MVIGMTALQYIQVFKPRDKAVSEVASGGFSSSAYVGRSEHFCQQNVRGHSPSVPFNSCNSFWKHKILYFYKLVSVMDLEDTRGTKAERESVRWVIIVKVTTASCTARNPICTHTFIDVKLGLLLDKFHHFEIC